MWVQLEKILSIIIDNQQTRLTFVEWKFTKKKFTLTLWKDKQTSNILASSNYCATKVWIDLSQRRYNELGVLQVRV